MESPATLVFQALRGQRLSGKDSLLADGWGPVRQLARVSDVATWHLPRTRPPPHRELPEKIPRPPIRLEPRPIPWPGALQ